MAIAAVLKTAVRKDFWVRIPGPPLHDTLRVAATRSTRARDARIGARVRDTTTHRIRASGLPHPAAPATLRVRSAPSAGAKETWPRG